MHDGTDAIFKKKKTTENFPNLMKDLNLQIYIAQTEFKKKSLKTHVQAYNSKNPGK